MTIALSENAFAFRLKFLGADMCKPPYISTWISLGKQDNRPNNTYIARLKQTSLDVKQTRHSWRDWIRSGPECLAWAESCWQPVPQEGMNTLDQRT